MRTNNININLIELFEDVISPGYKFMSASKIEKILKINRHSILTTSNFITDHHILIDYLFKILNGQIEILNTDDYFILLNDDIIKKFNKYIYNNLPF